MLDIFRTQKNEMHIWRRQYEEKIQTTPLVISDIYNIKQNPLNRYTIVKDIPLLEDIVRRYESKEISFDLLYEYMNSLESRDTSFDEKVHMLDMISMIR